MIQLRIVQYGPNSFAVQKKGWFLWRHVIYEITGGYYHPKYFDTKEQAKQWVDDALGREAFQDRARAFKKKVVWP